MRLFYGISLPDDLRQTVCTHARICQAEIPGRYVREENYHITLAFLGDVPPQRIDDAADVLARCLRAFPAPRLTLGETGFFGRAQNAILIQHVHSDPPLEPLHEALILHLAAADLPHHAGPFSAHITLARHADASGTLPSLRRPTAFRPSHAHLYLSARNADDVLCYTPIRSISFP